MLTLSVIKARFLRFLRPRRCPECGERGYETYCGRCGYELVAASRAAADPRRTS